MTANCLCFQHRRSAARPPRGADTPIHKTLEIRDSHSEYLDLPERSSEGSDLASKVGEAEVNVSFNVLHGAPPAVVIELRDRDKGKGQRSFPYWANNETKFFP